MRATRLSSGDATLDDPRVTPIPDAPAPEPANRRANRRGRQRTRTLAGVSITLTSGRCYLAARPFATRGMRVYPVSIHDVTSKGVASILQCGPARVVGGLSYDEANDLLNAFNTGTTGFGCRIW